MKSKMPRRALILGIALLPVPGTGWTADPGPAAQQEESAAAPAPREKVRVLEPLPEPDSPSTGPAEAEPSDSDPADDRLERTVLDQRLVEPPGASPPETAALATVRDWAEAWSSQEVERYLSFYAREFQPPGGQARETWENDRRSRIVDKTFIEVDVSFVEEPRWLAPERLSVRLRQVYNSDSFADVVDKELVLVLEDGGWKILRESTVE